MHTTYLVVYINNFFGLKSSTMCFEEGTSWEGGEEQGSQDKSHRKHIHRLAYAYHVRQLFWEIGRSHVLKSWDKFAGLSDDILRWMLDHLSLIGKQNDKPRGLFINQA